MVDTDRSSVQICGERVVQERKSSCWRSASGGGSKICTLSLHPVTLPPVPCADLSIHSLGYLIRWTSTAVRGQFYCRFARLVSWLQIFYCWLKHLDALVQSTEYNPCLQNEIFQCQSQTAKAEFKIERDQKAEKRIKTIKADGLRKPPLQHLSICMIVLSDRGLGLACPRAVIKPENHSFAWKYQLFQWILRVETPNQMYKTCVWKPHLDWKLGS